MEAKIIIVDDEKLQACLQVSVLYKVIAMPLHCLSVHMLCSHLHFHTLIRLRQKTNGATSNELKRKITKQHDESQKEIESIQGL